MIETVQKWVASPIMIILLFLFSINLPQGIWNLNPLWIFLFSRVQGLAFTTVHTSSVYGIAGCAAYLAYKNREEYPIYHWIALLFASAGIHEWALYLWDFVTPGSHWGTFAWQDAIWFAGFIIFGLVIASPKQRGFLLFLAVILIGFEFLYVTRFHDSDLEIGIYTVKVIGDNFIEVASWLIIPVLWLLYED